MRLAYARQVEAWSHTAQVLSMLHNVNRGKDAEPTTARDFHPLVLPESAVKVSLFELRGIPCSSSHK